MLPSDKRQLQKMLYVLSDARANRTSLVDAANSLLFLRNALSSVDREWEVDFTAQIATLESAGLATDDQRKQMGAAHAALVAQTFDRLQNMITNLHTEDHEGNDDS